MTPITTGCLRVRRWVAAAAIGASAGVPAFLTSAALCADAPSDSRLVQLPPFIVTDARLKFSNWTWGFMSFPGYEVLTGCDRGTSNEFVMGAARQLSILRDIAPAVFESPPSVPTSLILLNWNQAQGVAEDMKRFMASRPEDINTGTASLWSHIIFFPQLRLHDSESTSINLILGDPRSTDAVILEPDYVRYLMRNRLPQLPPWYVEAMTDLYRNAVFSSSGVATDSFGRLTLGSTSVTFAPVTWISGNGSQGAGKPAASSLPMIPLEGILYTQMPQRGPDESQSIHADLWRAQSDLFLQWIIADRHRGRINALKKFLDCCDAGRRDEGAFRECFGLDFVEMQDELRGFLRTATDKPIAWHSEGAGVDDVFRDATSTEVARIWGNWELLEMQFVGARDPKMLFPYIDQADHTLGEAYRKGERDPGFLSVYGLYENERGDPEKASAFLEAAVAERSAYARAYTELARIRLKAALARLERADARLSADQVAKVLAPLREARRLSPPQKSTFMLFALALENSANQPSPEDMAVLAEGLRFFPSESELATMVAALKDRRGVDGLPRGPSVR
jgi:hypothetical protein